MALQPHRLIENSLSVHHGTLATLLNLPSPVVNQRIHLTKFPVPSLASELDPHQSLLNVNEIVNLFRIPLIEYPTKFEFNKTKQGNKVSLVTDCTLHRQYSEKQFSYGIFFNSNLIDKLTIVIRFNVPSVIKTRHVFPYLELAKGNKEFRNISPINEHE